MLYLGLTSFLFLLRFALAGQGTARNQLYFIVLARLFCVLSLSLPGRL